LTAADVLLTFVAIFILAVIIVATNYAERERDDRMRRAVITALLLVNALIVAIYGVMQVITAYTPEATYTSEPGDFTPPAKPDAWGALLVSVIVAGLATLVLYRPVRIKLAVLFPRFRGEVDGQADAESPEPASRVPAELQPKLHGTPLFPQMLNYYTTDAIMVPRSILATSSPVEQVEKEARPGLYQVRGFNPDSMVHMVALVMCVYLVGIQVINFILGGGLAGVARMYEGGLTGWDLLVNAAPFVILAPLGVGLGLRRNWSLVLKRLGLEKPTLEGVMAAVGVTIALFVFVSLVAAMWMGLVSKATYEEQTKASDALWPTAIIFAFTHIQYTLTPAWLIILGVALAFGWIRERYSTTISMLTHFMYNFIPLAAGVSVSSQGLVWLLHLL